MNTDMQLVFGLFSTMDVAFQGMMYQLFVHGPFTTGIFRRSANQRQCRELQETLDSGHAVAFDEQPILVIGATFKVTDAQLSSCGQQLLRTEVKLKCTCARSSN